MCPDRLLSSSSPFDALKETRIVLKLVIKPVILRLESDQDSGRLSMASYNNLLLLRLTQKS